MARKTKHRTELTAFINDEDKCDVLMSGTPDDILDCIGSSIKAFSIRLMEEPDIREMQKDMDIPDDMLQTYLQAMVMNELINLLGDVSPIVAKFEVDPEVDGNTTIDELIERFTKSSETPVTEENLNDLIPEDATNSLDFDVFSSEEDNNE